MRNLKRALSLALASIMVLGLMVVGSSAAESYTDVTEKHNVEAIEVLQSVSPAVMEGTGDNKFEPEKQLTRNEMAVIMCRLLDYTVASYKGTSPFTDVPAGHWAEEYVAACYTNGIIAGYSSTYFGGDDMVTTGQAALMIEKALGYFQEQGDFGSDWLVEAIRVGSQAKLFDGIKAGARDALDRNNAAKMCLNALQADMVEVSGHDLAQGANGQLTTKAVYTPRTAPFEETKYTKISADKDTQDGNRQIIQLGEELYDGDLKKTTGERDDFGRPATKWSFKSDEIGTYVKDSWLVGSYTAKVTKKDIYDAVGKGVYDDLTRTTGTPAVLYNYVDGVPVVNGVRNPTLVENTYVNKNDTGTVNLTGNGTVTEVYVNTANSETTIVTINTWVFQAAGDYSASREAVDLVAAGDTEVVLTDRTLEVDVFPEIADFKADDYILVTGVKETTGSTRLEAKTVQKAEVVTGEVSAYSLEDSVTLDGKVYKYSKTAKKTSDTDASSEPVKSTQYTVGLDAAVVLDAYGYIIAVDDASVSDNYVYVSEFAQPSGLANGEVRASAYFTDGTTSTITVAKRMGKDGKTDILGTKIGPLSDPTSTDADDIKYVGAAGWYTYSVSKNGEYTLYAPESKYTDMKTAQSGGTPGSASDDSGTGGILEVNKNATELKPYVYDDTEYEVMKNDKVDFVKSITSTDATWNRAGSLDSSVAGNDTEGTEARATDKTIVVVHNLNTDDTDLYVGAKNIPDIKVKATGTVGSVSLADGAVYMNILANKTTKFADYVFVEVYGNVEVSGGSDSNLVYVTAYDAKNYTTDNDTNFTYKVLDENAKETKITADNAILGEPNSSYVGSTGHTTNTGSNGIYRAFYKGRMNSDDQYTDLKALPVGDDGRFVSSAHTAGYQGDTITGGRIEYKDGSLVFTGTGGGSWNKAYTANSSAKVVLVTLKDAAGVFHLNLDKDANYKAEITSAKSLGDRLRGFVMTYSYQAKLTEKEGSTIEELYVTVHQAVDPNAPTPPPPPTSGYDYEIGNIADLQSTIDSAESGESVGFKGTVTAETSIIPKTGVDLTLEDVKATKKLTVYGNAKVKGTIQLLGNDGALDITGTPTPAADSKIEATQKGTGQAGADVAKYVRYAETVEVNKIADDFSSVVIPATGTLKITGAMEGDELDDLPATNEGATLIVGTKSTGTAPDGTVAMEVNGATVQDLGFIPAATYTADGTKWEATVAVGANYDLSSASTGNANIKALFKLYDKVTLVDGQTIATGALDITGTKTLSLDTVPGSAITGTSATVEVRKNMSLATIQTSTVDVKVTGGIASANLRAAVVDGKVTTIKLSANTSDVYGADGATEFYAADGTTEVGSGENVPAGDYTFDATLNSNSGGFKKTGT